jgi:hypothetical protein
MYNGDSWPRNSTTLIIDRHISMEIVRPFCLGLGLLVLIFIGYSSSQQLALAAQGQLGLVTAFKLIGFNTLITLEILLRSFFLCYPPSESSIATPR